MRPETVAVAFGLWVALVLLLPKRSVWRLGERLRLLGRGERSYLYGPPTRPQVGGPGGPLRWLRANAAGIAEVGIPLFILGAAIGVYGRQRRRELQLVWAASERGLAWGLVETEVAEEEVTRQLAALGEPALRTLPVDPAGAFERPPLSWTREWEAELAPIVDPEEAGGGEAQVPFRRRLDPGLSIRTLGPLSIRSGDKELAESLLRRPVLAFLWVLLLILALDERGLHERPFVAEELAPGIGRPQQLERMRGRLRDISLYLDPALSAAIVADARTVRLDLTNCSVDLLNLRSLVNEAKSAGPLLPDELLREATEMLDGSAGEFLPEWESLEQTVSGGRGSAQEFVERLREGAERDRVDLLVAVAEAHIARRNPARAIPFLEEVHNRRPDLEPAARRFAQALHDAGQPLRAQQVAAPYGFSA